MPSSVIKSEGWEAVNGFNTVGGGINGIDGWVEGNGVYTIENTNVNSGIQAVQVTISTLNPNMMNAVWNTNDTNNGVIQVKAAFKFPTPSAQYRWGVLGRMTNITNTAGNGTWYQADIEVTGSTTPGVFLQKRFNGTYTPLSTSVSGINIAPATWYYLQLICNGTALAVNVQRPSDAKWLDSTGNWQTTQQNCITASDSSIGGAGKSGIRATITGTGDIGFTDDWLLEALSVPSPLTPMFGPARTQTIVLGY
jgi:hypothetical protein